MPVMLSRIARPIVSMVTIGALLVGCTKTREAKIARMAPPAVKVTPAERTEPVRYSGHYVAMWTRSDSKHLRKIPASELYANKGERLGFQRTADGQLLGIHGDDRFELKSVPTDARYVLWYNEAEVPTQFARNMDAAGEVTGITLKYVAVGVLIVGGLYVMAKNSEHFDADCEKDDDGFDLSWLFGGDDDKD